MKPDHPSHSIVTEPAAARPNIKPTLRTKFESALDPYLRDGVIHPQSYKKVLSALHTSAVQSAIAKQGPNRVLGMKPPEVSAREKLLPQIHRTTLNQLSSGFCNDLKDYQHFITASPDDRCPDCHHLPQTTNHIFCCPANRTDLSCWDLWKHPKESDEFLSTTPSFAHLPPPSTSSSQTSSSCRGQGPSSSSQREVKAPPCSWESKERCPDPTRMILFLGNNNNNKNSAVSALRFTIHSRSTRSSVFF
jgi:hypothetical protein